MKSTFFTADKNKAADHVLHQNVPQPIQDTVHVELPDKAEAEAKKLDKQPIVLAVDTTTGGAAKTAGDVTAPVAKKLEPISKTVKDTNKNLNGPTKPVVSGNLASDICGGIH